MSTRNENLQRDHLTGLLSRAAFDLAMAAALEGATSQRPAALIMTDVDHFKKVNDGHGHQVGDTVLTELARRLAEVVDGKGVAYRYGGEEFALILPNHTVDEAISVGERARRSVEAEAVAGLSVTSSYGIALAPQHASTIVEWLKKADQALYDAKGLGRNLVRLFGEPPPEHPTPRRPARKAATRGVISEEDQERLRLEILRRGRARCPIDEIPLDHHDITSMGESGRSFIVNCPGCGFTAKLMGPGRI
jgi:diguanylate cyclase (GGDEF)-like protein